MMRHWDRISTQAFQWLLLGLAAAWLFWIRVWIAHTRLYHHVIRGGSAADNTDFLLEQAAQLAYIGLSLVGFATLGFLLAIWRVAGGPR